MNEQMNKEIKQKNTKKKLTAIILSIVLILAVIGVSFAAWYYTFNGTLTNLISTNDISLDLLESNTNIITIENALPMGDNDGKSQTQTFDFAVTSKTTKDTIITYKLSIEKLSVDSGYTAFNDDQIKVYLASYTGSGNLSDETQVVAPTLVSNIITSGTTGQLKANIVNSHNTANQTITTKYRLKMWIDSQVNASSWNASTKLQYKLKIKVDGQAAV